MTAHPAPRPAHVQRLVAPVGVRDLPVEAGRSPEDYEFQIVTIPRRQTLSSVRRDLTERAEYGRWELARTRVYQGGDKKVWLRRRIIRVTSTLHGPLGV